MGCDVRQRQGVESNKLLKTIEKPVVEELSGATEPTRPGKQTPRQVTAAHQNPRRKTHRKHRQQRQTPDCLIAADPESIQTDAALEEPGRLLARPSLLVIPQNLTGLIDRLNDQARQHDQRLVLARLPRGHDIQGRGRMTGKIDSAKDDPTTIELTGPSLIQVFDKVPQDHAGALTAHVILDIVLDT